MDDENYQYAGKLSEFEDGNITKCAVNGVAEIVRGSARFLRLLQTGSVRAYAVSLFVGVEIGQAPGRGHGR